MYGLGIIDKLKKINKLANFLPVACTLIYNKSQSAHISTVLASNR